MHIQSRNRRASYTDLSGKVSELIAASTRLHDVKFHLIAYYL